ncbi:MAG: type VI secretion system ImpA family N-terminal domain-containing protein [Alphaproteobacteria bacterium]|nr:type VI secretion system ImpA family N-terminal domain-containing protein [Alphaproteobacteria bacterium]
MSLDVEALLAPVSDEEPAGPDLSYDPDFRRISRELDAALEKERPGDDPTVGPAVDTAVALLGRSRDLWIASHGFCFSLYSGDLTRCVGLLEAMAGIAERFWDTCHPALDEGSDPAGGRREACNQIASIGRAVKHLDRLYLPPLRSKGRISFKDIVGGADPSHRAAQLMGQMPEPLRRAIDESTLEDWQALADTLTAMAAASTRLAAAFADHVPGQGPDLSAFDQQVARMNEFAQAVVARKSPVAEAEAGDEGASSGGGDAEGYAGPSLSGPIRSRSQALAQLEAVKAFFAATEPSSPLPLLIDRAVRLAGMDFIQILQSLAPTGVEEASRVLEPSPGSADASGGQDSSETY